MIKLIEEKVVLEVPVKRNRNIIRKIEEGSINKIDDKKLTELYGDYKSRYCTRIKIDTFFRCNARCRYCYYISKVNEPFIHKKEILDQITKAKELKFKSIEFSGGESTIHPDFLECVKYAKSLGLITSVITNGYIKPDYLKKILDNGLDEVMFSIHGYKNTHDNIVKLSDAYNIILNNIILIKNYSINTKIRINLIINNESIFELDNIINDFINNIHEINLLPINEWEDAESIGKKSQNIIHDNIESIEKVMDKIIKSKIKLNIRYLEYCVLKEKYHKYLYNYLDHYFTNDWNPFFIYKYDTKNITEHSFNLENIKKDLSAKRKTQYHKTLECAKCPWNIQCDGFKN